MGSASTVAVGSALRCRDEAGCTVDVVAADPNSEFGGSNGKRRQGPSATLDLVQSGILWLDTATVWECGSDIFISVQFDTTDRGRAYRRNGYSCAWSAHMHSSIGRNSSRLDLIASSDCILVLPASNVECLGTYTFGVTVTIAGSATAPVQMAVTLSTWVGPSLLILGSAHHAHAENTMFAIWPALVAIPPAKAETSSWLGREGTPVPYCRWTSDVTLPPFGNRTISVHGSSRARAHCCTATLPWYLRHSDPNLSVYMLPIKACVATAVHCSPTSRARFPTSQL